MRFICTLHIPGTYTIYTLHKPYISTLWTKILYLVFKFLTSLDVATKHRVYTLNTPCIKPIHISSIYLMCIYTHSLYVPFDIHVVNFLTIYRYQWNPYNPLHTLYQTMAWHSCIRDWNCRNKIETAIDKHVYIYIYILIV